MQRGTFHAESGTSLIEVMIAGGLLCGAVVTVAALLTGSASLMTAARHRSYATVLARAKIDDLLAASQMGTPIVEGADAVDGSGVVATDGIYARRWRLLPPPSHGDRLVVLVVEVVPRVSELLRGGRAELTTIVEREP
jgi:hypothetical protein